MSLASIIALVSSANVDPSAMPDHDEVETVSTVIGRNAPAKGKKSAIVAKGEQKAPIHDGPKVFGVTMPTKGTINARDFLKAMLNAGRRTDEHGMRFTDPQEVRNDKIQAIAAFVGYDTRRDFGGQEIDATASAQREIRGYKATGPTREEQRAASRTLSGFVAGMPQPSQRLLLNLQAREQSTVAAMLAAETDKARNEAKAMLVQIQAAIAELGA